MTRELLTLHLAHCFPVSFVEMSNPSVRWSQILTHWSLSRKATVSQQQRFPTTASQPHCQSVRLLEQGFKLSIWLGRSLDPKHSPRQVYNWQEKLRLFWRLGCFQTTQIGSENPGQRTISARVASNTLETTSMWNTSTKTGSFWESFELELENQKPACQRTKTFEPQVPISTAPTSRRPMMYLYIYKEHSFLLGLFLCLFLQKLFVAQNTVRLLRMCAIQFEVDGKKSY